MKDNDDTERDKFTYSESVQINIGNYENRSRFAAFSSSIMKKGDRAILKLNNGETKMRKKDETISHLVERVIGLVKKTLLVEERAVRKLSKDDVTFDTLCRIPKKYE